MLKQDHSNEKKKSHRTSLARARLAMEVGIEK